MYWRITCYNFNNRGLFQCIGNLLAKKEQGKLDDEVIECLAKLFSTVGLKLESECDDEMKKRAFEKSFNEFKDLGSSTFMTKYLLWGSWLFDKLSHFCLFCGKLEPYVMIINWVKSTSYVMCLLHSKNNISQILTTRTVSGSWSRTWLSCATTTGSRAASRLNLRELRTFTGSTPRRSSRRRWRLQSLPAAASLNPVRKRLCNLTNYQNYFASEPKFHPSTCEQITCRHRNYSLVWYDFDGPLFINLTLKMIK